MGFARDTLFNGIETHDVEYKKESPFYELFNRLQVNEDHDGINRADPDTVTSVFKSAILNTKYIEWKYESEKRAIYYDTESTMEKQGGVPFSPNNLREVIFGHKISEVYKSSIMEIMKHPDFNSALLFQAERLPFDYSLKLEPLPAMK